MLLRRISELSTLAPHEDRAESVVKYLEDKGSIDGDRLSGKGVGPLCPVGSNKTEKGRAKNRRVELVLKK